MRKHNYIAFVLFIMPLYARAQFLTQSADGKSSIPLPISGFGLGFDLGKSELTAGLNNYKKAMNSSDKKFKNNYLLGMMLSVKNSEGTGHLFSSGDIVPHGNLLGFAGFSFNNNKRLIEKY